MKLSSLTEKPIDVNTNLVTTVDGGGGHTDKQHSRHSG